MNKSLKYLHDWTLSNRIDKKLFFYQYCARYVHTCFVLVFALIYDHSLAIRTHVTRSINSLYVSDSWEIQRNRACLETNLNCSHSLFCTCKYCDVEWETSLSCWKHVLTENHVSAFVVKVTRKWWEDIYIYIYIYIYICRQFCGTYCGMHESEQENSSVWKKFQPFFFPFNF